MRLQESEARRIFLEAIDKHPPDQWDEFVERVCSDDLDLHRRVQALLQALGDPHPILDGAAVAGAQIYRLVEQPGATIGRYKLLQEIGEGGMGIVYEAEQQEPVQRKVALKIVKPGVDTREVVRRFEFERQALALMDHPNIAHMLDAGATESGRPYFVMELVEGTPITDYCDREELTVAQRLELFVLVCQAVQHAHQKGIIHRDLKPTNVLVAVQDAKPVPKIVDFGVAKAMGRGLLGETTSTHAGQMVGTPLYMSPEQAEGNGQKVDTRSDAYSLGVVLYELLTGTTPFEKERFREANFEQVCAAIRSEDPPAPSSRISTLEAAKATTIFAHRKTDRVRLSHLLRSDLDWIVMKALEKDPERRYATARDLAEDVRRFLDGEPIHARPPSLLDRVGKWTRRHRTAVVSAGSIAAILLVATTVVALAQRRAALSERELGQRRIAVQTGINNALAEATRVRGQVSAGALGDQTALMRAREQVQRAVALAETGQAGPQLIAQVRGLLSELDQEQLLADLDKAWMAQAETDVTQSRFAKEASIPLLREALRAYGLTVGQDDPAAVAARIKSRPLVVREQLLAALEEWGSLARPLIGVALRSVVGTTVIEQVVPGSPAARDGRLKKGDQLVGVGQGRDGAIVDTRTMKSPEIAKLLCGKPGTTVRLRVVPVGTSDERVYEIEPDPTPTWLRAVVEATDTDPWRRRMREAFALADKAQMRAALEKLAEDADIERQPVRTLTRFASRFVELDATHRAVALLRQVRRRHPGDLWANHDLAIGLCFTKPPQLEEAVRWYSAAVALRPDSAGLRLNLGFALKEQGKLDEAIAEYREALRLKPEYAEAHINLGIALRGQGKLEEAIAQYHEALRLKPELAVVHANMGAALHKQGKLDEAIAEYREAIRLQPEYAMAHFNLGITFLKQEKLDEAIASFREALRLKPEYAEAQESLGVALGKQGKQHEAIASFREAIRLKPEYAQAHHSLGVALWAQGKQDEAIAQFREVLRLKPDDALGHRSLGFALEKYGNLEEAVAEYRAALRIQPADPCARSNLAWLFATSMDPKWRRPAEALELAVKAVALPPEHADHWGTLGVARYQNGQWRESITTLTKAIELGLAGEDKATASLFLAMAHWQLDEKDRAREWHDKATTWMKDNKPNDELTRFRAEADALMAEHVPEPKSKAQVPAPAPKGGASSK